jgi:hypothetical protein
MLIRLQAACPSAVAALDFELLQVAGLLQQIAWPM